MALHTDNFDDTIIALLQSDGVGVIRTDTLYGIVARAHNQAAVERIYKVKHRTPTKSPIVLIASTDQLFDTYDEPVLDRLRTLWPGKTSIILPSQMGPRWLTRDNESIAYRIPDNDVLCALLHHTGPLIAPSANPEGLTPATTIEQAKTYFGESVDFYVDHGAVTDNTPSKLYRLHGDGMERLR